MQPVTDAHPAPNQPGGHGAPGGAVRMSTVYFDQHGVRRVAGRPVPVNQYGQITAADFRCPQCKKTEWVPLQVASRGVPVCEDCNRRMTRREIGRPPLLPWGQIWKATGRPLRAVWVGAGTAGLGELASAGHAPGPAAAVAAPLLGIAAKRVAERRMLDRASRRNRVDDDAPGQDKRIRAAIARRARTVGYCTASGCGWVGLAASTGLDPHVTGGRVSWLALVAMWLPGAATWWRHVRNERNRPEPPPIQTVVPDTDPDTPPPLDPDEAETRRIWATIVAAQKGRVIGRTVDGHDVLAPRNGKLVETRLEDWHKVTGGWAATAVGPDGAYVADQFIAARSAVASAFRMKTSMITCIPDPDDENRALYLAQRTSPIGDVVRWAGPDSIDVEKGVAPVALYADGEPVLYEIYRPGWGVPHVGAFGTTGSGKSEFINQLFTIDRWAQWNGQGIVADFLIDPQQGQSFAPFLDELAAPVADSLEAALLLVRALHAEMLRRNRYLAREAKTWDEKRGKWRRGRKWWNPLVDGPILALTIDEAHLYLANKEFAGVVGSAARMWRKCGGQLRIATHTPLLTDLGGSMALRDMLTSGFVWVGRVANSLSGPVAFNGRLPADPRSIPNNPGAAYILTGLEPKAMLARTMWEPDYYEWIRDEKDEPIGYPAELPWETLATFEASSPNFSKWMAAANSGDLWVPGGDTAARAKAEPASSPKCLHAVLDALGRLAEPVDMDSLDAALRGRGHGFGVRTIRGALKELREAGLVFTSGSRHELTPQARAAVETDLDAVLKELEGSVRKGGAA